MVNMRAETVYSDHLYGLNQSMLKKSAIRKKRLCVSRGLNKKVFHISASNIQKLIHVVLKPCNGILSYET